MTRALSLRHLREIKYDPYYKRMGYVGVDPCVYCGAPSTSLDHVPPLVEIEALDGVDLWSRTLHKYPACSECNTWLSDVPYKTLAERRRHLLKLFRYKFKKELAVARSGLRRN